MEAQEIVRAMAPMKGFVKAFLSLEELLPAVLQLEQKERDLNFNISNLIEKQKILEESTEKIQTGLTEVKANLSEEKASAVNVVKMAREETVKEYAEKIEAKQNDLYSLQKSVDGAVLQKNEVIKELVALEQKAKNMKTAIAGAEKAAANL